MTEAQEDTPIRASEWLELANGGGVMLRDPNANAAPPPRITPSRGAKQLTAGSGPLRA